MTICSEVIKIMKLLVINSVIKGYHLYHFRSHISMVVKREHSLNENAINVEIPKKEDLPVHLLE